MGKFKDLGDRVDAWTAELRGDPERKAAARRRSLMLWHVALVLILMSTYFADTTNDLIWLLVALQSYILGTQAGAAGWPAFLHRE